MGNYPEALRQFTKALLYKPAFAEAHDGLGQMLYLGGDLDGASEHFSAALRLKPDFSGAGDNLRRTLERKKEQLLQRQPKDSPEPKAGDK